jgi:hypothetical protein
MDNPTPCLHCAIRDAIADHYAGAGDLHGDRVVVDCDKTLTALEDVLGEILAGIPDHDERSEIFKGFLTRVVKRVNFCLEHDLAPDLLPLH